MWSQMLNSPRRIPYPSKCPLGWSGLKGWPDHSIAFSPCVTSSELVEIRSSAILSAKGRVGQEVGLSMLEKCRSDSVEYACWATSVN